MDARSRMPQLLVFALACAALLAGLAFLASNLLFALAGIDLVALWAVALKLPRRTLVVWSAGSIGVALAMTGAVWLVDTYGSRVADGLWVQTSFTNSGEDVILRWPHLVTAWGVVSVDSYGQEGGAFVPGLRISTYGRQTYLAEAGNHVVALSESGSLSFLRVESSGVQFIGTYEIPRVNGTEPAEYVSIAWDGDLIAVGAHLFEAGAFVVRVLGLSNLSVVGVETYYLPRAPTDIEPIDSGFAIAAGDLFLLNNTTGTFVVDVRVAAFEGVTQVAASSDVFAGSRRGNAGSGDFEILFANRDWEVSRVIPFHPQAGIGSPRLRTSNSIRGHCGWPSQTSACVECSSTERFPRFSLSLNGRIRSMLRVGGWQSSAGPTPSSSRQGASPSCRGFPLALALG